MTSAPIIWVRASGPANSPIAFVGEAPGADEERVGLPFIGAAGRMLTAMCMSVGIDRRSCYITNVVKRRPPGNDFRREFFIDHTAKRPCQRTPELTLATDALRTELLGHHNVVVALGEYALQALTGHSGITDWRGSIIDAAGMKVIPTYHPSSVLRKYEQRVIVEHDLRRALEESKTPAVSTPVHDFLIAPSFSDAMDRLRMIRPCTTVAFDIETLGVHVRCLGFATSPVRAFCIPFAACQRAPGLFPGTPAAVVLPRDATFGSYWTEPEELVILTEIDRVLSDPTIPKRAQNAPFDMGFLEREFGIVCEGLAMDSMVAQHCCYCELPKGLDFLCSFYTRVPCYWRYNAASDRETWTYNCYDCAVTYEACDALAREMKEIGT